MEKANPRTLVCALGVILLVAAPTVACVQNETPDDARPLDDSLQEVLHDSLSNTTSQTHFRLKITERRDTGSSVSTREEERLVSGDNRYVKVVDDSARRPTERLILADAEYILVEDHWVPIASGQAEIDVMREGHVPQYLRLFVDSIENLHRAPVNSNQGEGLIHLSGQLSSYPFSQPLMNGPTISQIPQFRDGQIDVWIMENTRLVKQLDLAMVLVHGQEITNLSISHELSAFGHEFNLPPVGELGD